MSWVHYWKSEILIKSIKYSQLETLSFCISPSFLLLPVGVEVCGRVLFDELRSTVYLLSSWQKPLSMLSNNQCRDTQYTFHFRAHSYFWPATRYKQSESTVINEGAMFKNAVRMLKHFTNPDEMQEFVLIKCLIGCIFNIHRTGQILIRHRLLHCYQ